MRKCKLVGLMLVLSMMLLFLGGCGGSGKAPASSNAAAGEVNTSLDSKYVSKDYMVTMLLNADCVVKEDKKAIVIATPSEKSMVVLKLYPGVQNLAAAANNVQAGILSNYENGQAGQISDGYMFGQRAKLVPFTCTNQGTPVEGLATATIANQSLYTLTVVFDSKVSQSERDLVQNVIDSMKVIVPEKVDQKTKKAVYKDPYAQYTVYYGEHYDWYEINEWDVLPYYYYAWWDGDYSAWNDPAYFQPDYDYYADDTGYWSWGWDEEDEWAFYSTYADYYDYAYYEELPDYSEDFSYDEAYDPWTDVEEEWQYYEENDGVDPYDSDAGYVEDDGVNAYDSDGGYDDEEVNAYDSDGGYDDEGVNAYDSDAGY